MIQGLRKERKTPVRQAAPIGHHNLLSIFQQVNLNNELEVVTWVLLLVGFSLVLRVLNLGPVSRDKFDPEKNFCRSDLVFKQGYWILQVKWSKTIQFRNKVLEAPLVPSHVKQICPQYWVMRMVKLIPAGPREPLFLVCDGHNRYPLTSGQVNRLLNKWCTAVGLDAKLFTGHCLRRGGLTFAHKAKLTNEST